VSQTAEKETCPECGLEMPANGGCPGCSLRLALSADFVGTRQPPPAPPGLKSRFFGDYEILEEIARGGMGVVYRARQLGLNRMVALKMVQANHLLSDEARLRFRVEIEAVAQLSHPHIVSLFESGDQDGTHYFTMRLVEGGDLAAYLKREHPLQERMRLLVKVCRAVHYAHQRGILHRDLKPSNILVDLEGEPHVADFGLAKSVDHDTGFTFTSSVLGSPNYMAPEQANGKSHQLTTAVDVYGLGAILYHMLAGRPPFQARTPIETLRQVVDVDVAAPSTFGKVDRDLETIALKCLRKEPSGRYGTAEDLAQDLERWLAGEPILARRLGRVEAVLRWTRRHPAAAGLGTALAVALTAIAVGTGVAAVRIKQAEQKATSHLRDSLLREARSLRLGSELGHREDGLRLIREAAALGGTPEYRMRLRDELLATVARIEPRFVKYGGTNANSRMMLNALHQRNQLFAAVEDETNVVFHTVNGASRQGRLVLREPITSIDGFSPNSLYIALRHREALRVLDLRNGKVVFNRAGTNVVYAFHPRENSILVQGAPNEAVLYSLTNGAEKLRWTAALPRDSANERGWRALSYSPSGRMVAAASIGPLSLELLNPNTGRQIRALTNSSRMVAMAWAPDGNRLAVSTEDGTALIWQAARGNLIWTSPAMIAPAHTMVFHPRRDWLALGCRDDKVRFIDTYQQRFVFETDAATSSLNFSPHGIRLGPVWSNGKPGFLENRRAEAFTSFGVGGPQDRFTDGSFTPDGTVLATGHSEVIKFCSTRLSRVVARKDYWRMAASAFHPVENYMVATDVNGISRYSYKLNEHDATLAISPIELLHPGDWRAMAFTPDGTRFAAYNMVSNTVHLFDHTLTNQISSFGSHTRAESLALSPDARWAATAGRTDRAIRLWNVEAQTEVTNFVGTLQPRSAFSPDGRWFAVMGDKLELLEVGTWRPSPPFKFRNSNDMAGAVAFSPDSRMLAMIVNRFEVHLFDLRTFDCIGVLRPPGTVPMLSVLFSPDGSQLAGTAREGRVAIWNMQHLEKSLAEFGLSWD
jgi:WD40 repeat protein